MLLLILSKRQIKMNYEIRTPRGKASHSHNLTMRNKYLDSSFCINTVQNVIPFLRKKSTNSCYKLADWQSLQPSYCTFKMAARQLIYYIPYARHHNPLLIISRFWILTIHKDKLFWKNLLENKEMVFKNGVINIQAAG